MAHRAARASPHRDFGACCGVLQETIEAVLARVRAAAGVRALVDLYGSSVYAPLTAGDVDILVSHDEPMRLGAALGFEVIPTTPPRLHGVLEGVPVDISVVNGDNDLARNMRFGPRDATLLAERLRESGRDEEFQVTWPHVRTLVQRRALGHNGLGWFGSFGWALLLAIPLINGDTTGGLPAWLRWMAKLAYGARVALDGQAASDGVTDPIFIAAPTPPARDVARLSKRAAEHLFGEARAAAVAIGDASTDAQAIERITDIAASPPSGTTLVISGESEHSRGRYDGMARRLLKDLEALGPTRSWGRFDHPEGDEAWEHRITVATSRAAAATDLAEHWLAISNIDAIVS